MAAIAQKFGSGPVGVAALAAVLSEEIETIEDVYEPTSCGSGSSTAPRRAGS